MQSGSALNQNNSHTTDVSDGTGETLHNGFVCLRMSLKAILNSMRMFLMGLDQMEVYRTCDKDLKMKFTMMVKSVDNTLWRLRIVDSEGQKKTKSQQSVKEWMKLHDARTTTTSVTVEATSDDENLKSNKKVHRKKLKKRPKIAVKSDENDEASDDPIEFQLVTETSITENSENQTASRSVDSQSKRVRSIMSKLLMNPESLVMMCKLRNDPENLQKVIQVS
jgi:hypothetical protein